MKSVRMLFRSLVILIICLLAVSCGKNEASKTPMTQSPEVISACKLGRGTASNTALGFPKTNGFAPSTGTVNMTVLFVDFDDVPASLDVDSVFSILNPIVPDFFEETSYGRMHLQFQPHLEWLRLSKPSDYYASGIYDGLSHLFFIQEAVDLADAQVDFSQTHIVVVMTNPEAKAFQQGPTYTSLDPDYCIRADGALIQTGITSGYDLNHWGGIWLAHESGHSLSLPDLYHFGEDSLDRYVGTFGLMSRCDAKAPGYFAFERWMLGWIDDSQVYCHEQGEVILDLTAIEIVGGTKAIMVPLDSTSALAVESRREIGLDQPLEKEGALVYVVDTKLESGSGPIRVKPGVDNGNALMEDAPMHAGDTYTYQHVSVKVLESRADGDKIQVIVNH